MLTLLAVPVFYSYFEDLASIPSGTGWDGGSRSFSDISGGVQRKLEHAWASPVRDRAKGASMVKAMHRNLKRSFAVCILGFVMCTGTTPVNAQESENFTLPPRVGITGEVPMSLDEAIRMVLENNNHRGVADRTRYFRIRRDFIQGSFRSGFWLEKFDLSPGHSGEFHYRRIGEWRARTTGGFNSASGLRCASVGRNGVPGFILVFAANQ
jgi:hypothetical protein